MNEDINASIEKLKSGDAEAFEHIFNEYSHLAYKTAHSQIDTFGLSKSETDDVIQEAVIALYRAALTFDSEKKCEFGTYAVTCMKNRIVTYIRNRYVGKIPQNMQCEIDSIKEIPSGMSPEKLLIAKENYNALTEKINDSLTKLERDVFWLYLGDMSYVEIADKISVTTKTVDNAIRRIKAKLRKFL